MSYDEQVERIRQIREGRVTPVARDKTKKARRSVKKVDALKALMKNMTPEERAEFMQQVGKQ